METSIMGYRDYRVYIEVIKGFSLWFSVFSSRFRLWVFGTWGSVFGFGV